MYFSALTSSVAAYTQLTPPAGWVTGSGPTARALYRADAAAIWDRRVGGSLYAKTFATTTASGALTKLPVTLQLASTAGSVAARGIYGPVALASLTVAGLLAAKVWADSAGVRLITDPASREQRWENSALPTNIQGQPLYRVTDGFNRPLPQTFTSPEAACSALKAWWIENRRPPPSQTDSRYTTYAPGTAYSDRHIGSCVIFSPVSQDIFFDNSVTLDPSVGICPSGQYVIANNLCSSTPPPATISETDFIDRLKNKPIPLDLPKNLPFPLPVDDPVFNPDPEGSPRPIWVPTGDPVKDTKQDPSQPDSWTQPGVRISPSPTPTDPWNVDVVPSSRTSPTPTPVTEPTSEPGTGQPGQSQPQKEIITCGLPTTPPCKIDEKGTPTDPQLLEKTKPEDVVKPLKDFAENPKSKLPTLPTIAWSFALPTGCTSIMTPAFAPFLTEINVCQFQPMFHELMTMVWIILGIFSAITTFWRNVYAP